LLVNNAAINKAAPLDQVTEKSFDEHFAANVKSALFMSQAAARVFKPGAVIINISSLNSRYPSGHLYSATKAGSPNTGKGFRIRSEPAPYGALHRSLWESTCGNIIEAAATSASG
jgi:NAD(P)-dependent dehydrogenase (short-subunit alcohol dehydrogenase family)